MPVIPIGMETEGSEVHGAACYRLSSRLTSAAWNPVSKKVKRKKEKLTVKPLKITVTVSRYKIETTRGTQIFSCGHNNLHVQRVCVEVLVHDKESREGWVANYQGREFLKW